ncbi:MAG TPA: palindromic element RPE4 domain-containing protein [Rickettsia endosymbiont of Ceroptres masudai]|nr:palindromic element RPE4 domain-containing protein [Rickettsia endosymbiont of Ceroptres masudai]
MLLSFLDPVDKPRDDSFPL